jgi:hypothetical protein
MTRSRTFALVTLLVGLLSLASVATVNASVGSPCTGYAQEHCAQMAAMSDAALFGVATPAHTLAGNGMGHEHFEQITTVGTDLNDTSADANSVAATTVRFGQEHYEEIMAAINATN